ncbi:calcium-translocating P-type ATPase, PMCA-type [Lacrimispora sp.]|uniref:calcium-translocating P-type ATPase, PMCA-type n=1 Tax=Lacrimispora sp. TaxID=2719234 RepID=UPI00289F6FA6|nr:calcium-translocating P-type ATPase, PMCA-type [Lacrimispora sp.]
MNDYFSKDIRESVRNLKTDLLQGLSGQEAQKRLEANGHNRLQGAAERTLFQLFAEQFKDFLVVILIVAAIISMVVGIVQGEGIFDSLVIIAIVIVNAIIGVNQETKANNALKALKDMSSPQAKVIRNGNIVRLPSDELVTGDVVILDAGDYIPADVRLVESFNLKIDEAALTGESVPVEKNCESILPDDAPLGDRVNSAFMGTVITYGRGKGIVSATGMETQMGSIAAMLNESEEETTPLQKKLDSLGKVLGIVCIAVCAIIFVLGLLQGDELMEIFMVSVSLAVAAIPEGLTVVVTVILAMGMQQMVKSHAILKKLSAVETLGSTTVICSDKTGTLTQNKMTVVKVFDYEKAYDVTGTGYSREGSVTVEEGGRLSSNITELIKGAVLCNDAVYNIEKSQIIGDPTEGALLVLGEKTGLSKDRLNEEYRRVQEIPFDSDRKLMSTFHEKDGELTIYTKGAPDEILKRCTHIYKDGAVSEIMESDRRKILEANSSFAKSALRVLGVAGKAVETLDGFDGQENSLTYLGLICMIDPPREEVKPAVDECRKAGIRVKMITGDHKITASAIAGDLGIISPGEEALEGAEIQLLSEEELREKVKTVNVFARVSPEHKVRLVSACKANGEIVAMTGDGVNDAPSLKRADIGVAMGITGTDVSKEAADMILTDDNFVSIVHAVEEGRTIYNNIRKVVGYLLSCNIGEILLIFLAMLFNLPMPLMPIHLLSINLITDAFPAFALGMEEREPGIMDQKPRDPNESIIDKKMRVAVAMQSLFLGIGALTAFYIGHISYRGVEGGETIARTMCFVALILGELFRAYSNRSEKRSIFGIRLLSNSFLNKCVIASFAFLVVVVYVPFLNTIFSTAPLTLTQLSEAVGFAVVPTLGGELAKLITKRMK